jgi:Family of unknown function (DUF5522)
VNARDDPLDTAVRAAHDRAVREGEDGYVDPETGLFVFTAAYLEARGTCCDSGCRHCPYRH